MELSRASDFTGHLTVLESGVLKDFYPRSRVKGKKKAQPKAMATPDVITAAVAFANGADVEKDETYVEEETLDLYSVKYPFHSVCGMSKFQILIEGRHFKDEVLMGPQAALFGEFLEFGLLKMPEQQSMTETSLLVPIAVSL